ncbi:DUF4386 domain-containing protein [Flagellimonas sp. S174]|uniref:DUF4386 domain-containing protein n=1 Tax=Flagellimonas sp. S174 TaxID=3410790 RepID=UPI003BF4CA92
MQIKTIKYQQIARIAGATYLVLILLGIFSEAVVRSSLVSYSDASNTVDNLLQSEFLFRLGIVGDILVLFGDIVLAVLLFFLLKTFNKTLAVLAMTFRLAVVAVSSVNVLNMLSVLLLVSGSEYLKSFSVEQIESLVLFFFKLHSYGYDVVLTLFSAHCLIIGALFAKSRIIPSVFGIAFLITACCYFIFGFSSFLLPEVSQSLFPIILLPPLITELALALWLLVKGVSQSKYNVL